MEYISKKELPKSFRQNLAINHFGLQYFADRGSSAQIDNDDDNDEDNKICHL